MSLINCPDCGNERSDQNGSVCPKCGHVLGAEEAVREKSDKFKKKKEELEKSLKVAPILITVFLIIWAGFGLFTMNRYENNDGGWPLYFGCWLVIGFSVFLLFKQINKVKEDLQKHLDNE